MRLENTDQDYSNRLTSRNKRSFRGSFDFCLIIKTPNTYLQRYNFHMQSWRGLEKKSSKWTMAYSTLLFESIS